MLFNDSEIKDQVSQLENQHLQSSQQINNKLDALAHKLGNVSNSLTLLHSEVFEEDDSLRNRLLKLEIAQEALKSKHTFNQQMTIALFAAVATMILPGLYNKLIATSSQSLGGETHYVTVR